MPMFNDTLYASSAVYAVHFGVRVHGCWDLMIVIPHSSKHRPFSLHSAGGVGTAAYSRETMSLMYCHSGTRRFIRTSQ